MQAVFFEGNRTLRVGESVAVEPGAGGVQIRVAYCGICGTDLHLFHGAMAHRLTLLRKSAVARRRNTNSATRRAFPMP